MNKLKSLISIILFLSFSYSALAAEIDLLGLTLDVKESEIDIDNVNITVEIYDAATSGNLIYNQKGDFVMNIVKAKEFKYG